MAARKDRDPALLLDMLLAARDAQGFVEGLTEAAFLGSRLHQNTVVRLLEIIGEAASKVTPSSKAAHPDIPWRKMTVRNRLIHAYDEVQSDLVWTDVQQDLGVLIAALQPLVPDDADPV